MQLHFESQIEGDFNGFDDGMEFRLTNGQIWVQKRFMYKYVYKFRPRVKVWSDRGEYLLQIDGVDEMIAVTRQ